MRLPRSSAHLSRKSCNYAETHTHGVENGMLIAVFRYLLANVRIPHCSHNKKSETKVGERHGEQPTNDG